MEEQINDEVITAEDFDEIMEEIIKVGKEMGEDNDWSSKII